MVAAGNTSPFADVAVGKQVKFGWYSIRASKKQVRPRYNGIGGRG